MIMLNSEMMIDNGEDADDDCTHRSKFKSQVVLSLLWVTRSISLLFAQLSCRLPGRYIVIIVLSIITMISIITFIIVIIVIIFQLIIIVLTNSVL